MEALLERGTSSAVLVEVDTTAALDFLQGGHH